MTPVFYWVVTKFERLKSYDEYSNVISRVLGNLVCVDSDSAEKSVYPFAVRLDVDGIESFVDFNNINEQIVLEWIQSTWGEQKINDIKYMLVNEIEERLNTELVSPPWTTPT